MLVARGRTNAELFIGLSTVKFHITSVMAKLHVRTRVEMAIWPTTPNGCDPSGLIRPTTRQIKPAASPQTVPGRCRPPPPMDREYTGVQQSAASDERSLR